MALNRNKAEKKLRKWYEKLARAEAVIAALRAYLTAETAEEQAVKKGKVDTAETAANEGIPEDK